MEEARRKVCFEQLRHKNACSIDELKSKLRKLYVQDLKTKRERVLKDKRDMNVTDEDNLDFFKDYCRRFFGQYEDPWDVDEEILTSIWEEIKLEELERDEAEMIESLVGESQVVCPICLRRPATMQERNVRCACGFDYPLPPHITLKDFETALITSLELHNMSCDASPIHQVCKNGTLLQFASSCESCQTFSIIFECPKE